MAASTETTAIDVVKEFLGALECTDVDAALALLDPGIVYQNVPFPPARGIRAVERQLRSLERFFSGFEVEFHEVAANGHVVLTERTDVLGIGPVRGAFWVCGTFEVHDGRITLWRDRFDFVDFTLSFVRGALKALVGLGRR
jgi:limonene-1,2-epoxide hydrolase